MGITVPSSASGPGMTEKVQPSMSSSPTDDSTPPEGLGSSSGGFSLLGQIEIGAGIGMITRGTTGSV